ncbi:single-stranded DNA-binding protein [Liquorilactobacillus mali]|uniref:Single-stranded DNA-binding protein n=1 Tax=Liquorilactobacillus mali KCTC 3596 = DSM 20444 TaxID=1046596 RepID=A0A0R2EA67_9LACO|nr:single-stranded DNA-binding protein [Liquorilactobacillus mali]KRN09498.1 single-strand DNA binding protein [Liquorilactobacillus mali KCTC 3596 = DSM 20444]MDC7952471.1 single-stranded DNA-binding protein [Liquorilactobacillus mali]MDV7757398.1 single-stranded DNA-binding protein [Liquorilactobacillus mali]QFQ73638.1 single-stranded DNA-binding protein [Liquorilactobacillus mali]
MINRAILVGRLTRDPDLRYTSSGAAVATFTVAVNRQFTNQQGEREADFINCVIWRKAAENFANFTHKGSLIGVEGRIQTRSYENQQGNRVYVTEVIVDSFSLLESRSQSERQQSNNNSQSSSPSQGAKSNSGDNPFGNMMNNNNSSSNTNDADPFAGNGQQIDISDDDLPF